MLRAVLITPGQVLPRDSSYFLVAWTTVDRTFPFTNTLSDLGLLGAIYLSSKNAASAESLAPLKTLFIVAACVLAVEMTNNVAFAMLGRFIYNRWTHVAQALLLLSTDVAFLVILVLYRRLLHDDKASAVPGGDAQVATNTTFLWLSGICSALSFLSKVVPRELLLGVLARRTLWFRDVHAMAVTVRPRCCHLRSRVYACTLLTSTCLVLLWLDLAGLVLVFLCTVKQWCVRSMYRQHLTTSVTSAAIEIDRSNCLFCAVMYITEVAMQ